VQVEITRKQLWWHAAFAFVLSRIFVLAGAATKAVFNAGGAPGVGATRPTATTRDVIDVLTDWDGQWYLRVAQSGYPRSVPQSVDWFDPAARAAFFPLYPRLVHYVDIVAPAGTKAAALLVSWTLGAVAVALVGILALQVFEARVARRAMVLMALLPGSFVLSYAYSEGLLIVLAAATLWFLHRRWWVAAGVSAALATGTRPNAIALVLACVVASFLAIRERREWWSLAAPILSPAGYVAFHLFLDAHTGEQRVWFRVQREAWDEGLSLGFSALRDVGSALAHPLSSPANQLTLFTMVLMVLLVLASKQVRMPATWWAYSLGILFLMLAPSTVEPRPRFLFTAFPLTIGAAAWWPERDRDGWATATAICSAALVAIVAVYAGYGATP
jgi:4-amino-4-deoxy-L-arabinose transferase-like glycosyltransferase